MTEKSKIGLVGLAVMGENLALNIEEKGFPISVFNRTVEKVDAFVAENKGKKFIGARSPQELVASLERPRRIIMMVKAGAPVESTIETIAPLLEPGDILVDGGNEHFTKTEARIARLQPKGINFVGMGVSGGEEGARHGPSLMPGGDKAAWEALSPILTKIAAQVDDGPCVTYIGPGGSGHYVKMVHNGIEYGDMQLIAEAYDVLKTLGGLTNAQLGEVFEEWNKGELQSFLIEITARIFRKKDVDTGKDLLDVIVDTASMKGTGKWTVQDAAELASPVPTIASSVDARSMSAQKALREKAAGILKGPTPGPVAGVDQKRLVDDVRQALYCAKCCSYAQGMNLLRTASNERKWELRLGELARIWKGGCIIRAQFLGRIKAAYDKDAQLPNLLLDPGFAKELADRQDAWRRVVSLATLHGVALPTTGGSLAYYDSLRRERLPANIIQAQRDLFGAHTYQRIDRPGDFHTEW
ncbi:MAG: NADP-dependent phosphogluconate dehydrogenase [Myxococcota bacterium]